MRTVKAISDIFSTLLFIKHREGLLSAVLPVGSALKQVPTGLKLNWHFFRYALGALIGWCTLVLRLWLEGIRTRGWVFKNGHVIIRYVVTCCFRIQFRLKLSKLKHTTLFVVRDKRYTVTECTRKDVLLNTVELGRVFADGDTLSTQVHYALPLGPANHSAQIDVGSSSEEHRLTASP